jgi:hypothetical protein
MMTIQAVYNNWLRRFEDIKASLPEHATPSEWVSVVQLTSVHHVRSATIQALVKQGHLEHRSTDGFGPEVRITRKDET